MNRKFALTLLSSPALFASIISLVVTTQPASAGQSQVKTQLDCSPSSQVAVSSFTCQRRSHKTPTHVASQPDFLLPQEIVPNQGGELNFSEEESDAAIALFGCDCTSCLNALRQMRGMS